MRLLCFACLAATLNGDTVETAFIEEWYYVLDGQVHYYSNSKRLLP